MLFLCASAQGQDALQLLHQMQKALGGPDRVAAIRDMDELVSAQTWRDDGSWRGNVHKRTRWINPNVLRLDQVGENDNTYVLYFDGSSGWEIVPGQSGVVALVGDELQFAERYLDGLNFKVWLADREADFTISSPGPNIIRLASKRDAQNVLDVTLDPASRLPLKTTSPNSPGRETRFEQWETANAIQWPRLIRMTTNGKTSALITLDHMRLNSGLKQRDCAAKPADLKPHLRN